MEKMQLNPFEGINKLTMTEEERAVFFLQAKNGMQAAIDKFVLLETELIEKIILRLQSLNSNRKCTFTALYDCAVATIKQCIDTYDFVKYEKMIVWRLQKAIEAMLIEANK